MSIIQPTQTADELAFQAWYKKATRACEAICGLGLSDLTDGPSWDSWDSGMDPTEYAESRLEEEGFPL